jgi:beta-lactamase superfamily II metal-dependent hydrolase
MIKQLLSVLLLAAIVPIVPIAPTRVTTHATAPRQTLDIYFIDVEGGQATLLVMPDDESFLIDAGFPGDGTFASTPGDPAKARDAQRILAAARDAGVRRIDHLMLTHYHADHAGGVPELAQLIPITEYIDHAAPLPEADVAVPGTQGVYDRYVRLRASSAHLDPKPGDRLPIKGVEATVLSSLGATIEKPLGGSGAPNTACAGQGRPAQEKTENPRSLGVAVQFGTFRFLDLGDLSGPPLFALTCPADLIGAADVYLIAHHGGADAADAALFATVKPRVAVFDNGARKGGAAETFATLQAMPAIDVWQLHRSAATGVVNAGDDRIANLDESTSAWIKVSARRDGSFTVTNGRTGATTSYAARN